MIKFQEVSKIYSKESVALSDINLTIKSGEFVSLVGHSGAGKTTILRLILNEEKPTKGSVFFEDVNISKLGTRDVIKLRKRIGVVFQDFKLLPNKTAYENIAFAMEAVGKTDEEIYTDVPHVLDIVDLADKMDNFPAELSGGERQRLAIARAIINQPEIILADEPTGNLDPINTYEVVQILKKINDLGTTIILTTHNRGVIESIGRRVVTIEGGRIVRDDKDGKYMI